MRARFLYTIGAACILLALGGAIFIARAPADQGARSPFDGNASNDRGDMPAARNNEPPAGAAAGDDGSDPWQRLAMVNPDAIGWIDVPGTRIDHVVVASPPGHPDWYLSHDFQGRRSFVGCPYLDAACGNSLSDTPGCFIVYGHNLGPIDGGMFGDFENYRDEDWRSDRLRGTLRTPAGDIVLEFFAAETVDASRTGIEDLGISMNDLEGSMAAIANRGGFKELQQSQQNATLPTYVGSQAADDACGIEGGPTACADGHAGEPRAEDSLFVFCTCSYTTWSNERTLVYARGHMKEAPDGASS